MNFHIRALAALAMLIGMPVCHATLISYSATNVAESTWRYDYSIANDTLLDSLEEFTIYFDQDLFANLQVANSPLSWDSLVVQPDEFLQSDGFFDALTLDLGLSPGGTLAGFSVLFDFLGSDAPGSQRFEVVNPISFDVLDAGFTQPQVTSVPEPSPLALLSLGLLGVLFARRLSWLATSK